MAGMVAALHAEKVGAEMDNTLNLRYDHSLYDELELFVNICNDMATGGSRLYIYGTAKRQQMIRKFLGVCGLPFGGFVTSATMNDDVLNSESAVILGLTDRYYNEVYPLLLRKGVKNVIFLTEYAKNEIFYKLRPRERENLDIEVNITDHCNLNCQMCDHYSQLAEPEFLSLEEFERDIKRIADLTDKKLHSLALLGGEPLLHPQASEFPRLAREYLPHTRIVFHTNGLLLMRPNRSEIWSTCRDYNIVLRITEYPIKFDVDTIADMADKYNVSLSVFNSVDNKIHSDNKTSYRYPFDIEKSQPNWSAIACHQFNLCTVLRHGNLYPCPTSAYIGIFNRRFGCSLEHSADDSIDIYEARSFADIKDFLSVPKPFCQYCAVRKRSLLPWARSKKTIDEYVD
ncbi:MAG: radical SAM protein [Gracilibacteraceae bacterium]|jgi:sulfatase maturation enzyme AslB (radical SAM superfamily)|nr:radical SAM protein [Gracilibacteraceae bacterium]